MSNELEFLKEIFKFEIAAQEVYRDDVLGRIQTQELKNHFTDFLKEHEKHAELLSKRIEKISGTKPTVEKNLRGTLLTGYASVRGVTGEEGTVKALQTAERFILNKYSAAVKEGLPEESLNILRGILADEEKHNNYIDKVVRGF